MKIVDLSHLMNVHTPGWVGYAGNKMYYAQNLQTIHIVAQRINSALHVGTHIDGAMHGTDGMGDMASYPLDFLVWSGRCGRRVEAHGGLGRHHARDDRERAGRSKGRRHPHYSYRLASILGGKTPTRPGEVLLHASRRKAGIARLDVEEEDQVVGNRLRFRRSRDEHDDRRMRPDLAKQFEEKIGMSCDEFFGKNTYTHKRSGRKVVEDYFPFHSQAFQEGLIHAENVGGDIELMLNQRAVIGAFPWRYEGLEACPCRIVCFRASKKTLRLWEMLQRRYSGRGKFRPA